MWGVWLHIFLFSNTDLFLLFFYQFILTNPVKICKRRLKYPTFHHLLIHRFSLKMFPAAKSLQSCPTLCDRWQPTRLPHPWESPGKNTGVGCHFLLQCMKVKSLSRVWLFATTWTAAYKAPPPMGFSRQEYWSGVPLPSPILLLVISKTQNFAILENLSHDNDF